MRKHNKPSGKQPRTPSETKSTVTRALEKANFGTNLGISTKVCRLQRCITPAGLKLWLFLRVAGRHLHGRRLLRAIHQRIPAHKYQCLGSVVFHRISYTYLMQNLLADIALQYTLIYENTLQAAGAANYTGLLYHGYDYSHTAIWASPDRGHAPEIWDRALGWYAMAAIIQDIAPKLRDAADPNTGVWWLVMTQPGRAKNYFESSGSAMFVYSLLKGVRLGYIKDTDGSIVKAAKKAYTYMIANWVITNPDGTMSWTNTVEVSILNYIHRITNETPVQVGSLGSNGTYDVSFFKHLFNVYQSHIFYSKYYVSVGTILNDLKGLAAFLLASLEYEKL
jgi:rhamnogalacturonyl hydrolase YesR